MMKKTALPILFAVLLVPCASAQGEQPANIPRIGYLTGARLSTISNRTDAFRQGLRELGYIEGKSLIIEWRGSDGNFDRLPALAAELVRLKVDVIVLAPERSGKRLELLKEIVPGLSRVAVFGTSTEPSNAQTLKEIELVADALRIKLLFRDVLSLQDLESAFRAAVKERAGAVLMEVSGPITGPQRKEIAELAVKSRLPVMHGRREPVEAGGLMSYGVSVDDLDRRAATYVDKILKGAKPADLPVEQPKKFEFIINLKAAKQIGLTIPPNVLVRADKVIR